MKKKLFHFLLLPALFCSLLAFGLLATTGSAHAATLQAQKPLSISRVACVSGSSQLIMDTDWTGSTYDADCFSGTGSMSVKIYNVYDLYTGAYTLTWTWIDCNGATHHSSKGPGTYLSYLYAPGGFAGYDVMCEITYMAMS